MSASAVQICNLGLLKFGDITIVSLTEDTREGRACAILYPQMRDLMLSTHPWNFAMKRADISADLVTTPAFQWDYAYTLPVDCLQVWELYGSTAEWQIENGTLLTNQETEIYIRYLKTFETTGTFSPSFVNCLALRIGAEMSAKIKGNSGKRAALLQELYQVELPRAYRLNAIEGNRVLTAGEQSMDNANYSWQYQGRNIGVVEDKVFST